MTRAFLSLPLLLALPACLATGSEPRTDAQSGRALFVENCVACHGDDGRGTGEMAAHLLTAPMDLTQISARNGGSFPRDLVMSNIDGYARGAHFSAAMPEFGASGLGEVVMTDDGAGHGLPVPAELLALAAYLETIQTPG